MTLLMRAQQRLTMVMCTYLYEIDNDKSMFKPFYVVEDRSGKLSKHFDMAPYNTVVTDDRITVTYLWMTVSIFALDGNIASFYQKLLSLEDFDVSIRVCYQIYYVST